MRKKLKIMMHPKTITFITAVCFVAYTSSQAEFVMRKGRPERCVGNPDLLLMFCCALPPFFTREVAKNCGGATEVLQVDINNATAAATLKRYNYSCRYWFCVLDQYALINRDATLDHEKFFSHLDLWVTLNPSFTDVMIEAKLRCKQLFRYYFPLRICEFFKLNMCFRNYINVNCPVSLPSPECAEQKKFFKECGSYFV